MGVALQGLLIPQKSFAVLRNLFRLHFTLANNKPITNSKRFLGNEISAEIATESAVISLAVTSRLWVLRMVQVANGIAFVMNDEAHGLPEEVASRFIVEFGRPIDRFTHLGNAGIRANVVSGALMLVVDIVVSTKLEACVLRVAIHTHLGNCRSEG